MDALLPATCSAVDSRTEVLSYQPRLATLVSSNASWNSSTPVGGPPPVPGARGSVDRFWERRPAGGRPAASAVRARPADGCRRRRIPRRIARDGGQRVRSVGDLGRVPRYRVGRGSILGAEVRAIELELHARDADVVGCRG